MRSKAGVPICHKILRYVKDPLYIRYWEAKFSLLRSFLLLAPMCACRTARELWWTSQELSPASIIIITMILHAHISPGGWTIVPLVAAVLRHSLVPLNSINDCWPVPLFCYTLLFTLQLWVTSESLVSRSTSQVAKPEVSQHQIMLSQDLSKCSDVVGCPPGACMRRSHYHTERTVHEVVILSFH
jgi:hypothetical protein